ncbi:TRAP transporter small permease [Pseudoruegeria sp. SK021]|uniref:TRAP transporter small permease n=1 Tax=Pseudoruegeria sp. SK021 TaxID=1933035 RepID=UPI000A22D94A|nr:TRAP transporter small permease subunit [Pseudoruegeria sp. SK021]OSP56769.1 hypothetical protein BV911_02160 [Pseudoruegeria sp. SK021]
MLELVSRRVMRASEVLTGVMFFGMIVSVAMQVIARNVLSLPMLWTSDVAQLLFSWLIFIGAAIGLRKGAHYFVDILPKGNGWFDAGVVWFGIAMGAIVSSILVVNGWDLAMLRAPGQVQSLGISRFWLYVPIPISGAMMMLFLIEIAANQIKGSLR